MLDTSATVYEQASERATGYWNSRFIDDPRNRLYRHYVSVIRRLRPRTFVMENVPGLENLNGGTVRKQILEDLTLDGEYRVECRVLDAADEAIPGLYAVGEAAGFGGGGMHGLRGLEGTFLGGAILTGRMAGRSIGRAS